MSAYTPGPWIVDNGTDTRENMAQCLSDPACEWIAVGVADADGYAESVAYCHPINAPLVAQAPAMAEALREALACSDAGRAMPVRLKHSIRAILATIEGK